MAGAPVGYAGWGIRCASAYVGGETSMKRRPGCWACAQAITEAMPVCRTRVYSSLVIAAPEGQGNCARISDKKGRSSKEIYTAICSDRGEASSGQEGDASLQIAVKYTPATLRAEVSSLQNGRTPTYDAPQKTCQAHRVIWGRKLQGVGPIGLSM